MNKTLLERLNGGELMDEAIRVGERTEYVPSFFANGLFSLEALHCLLKEIKTSEQVPEKCKFLELGSGNGAVTILAASEEFDSYGIDINSDLVDLSNAFLKQLKREGVVQEGLPCKFGAGDYSPEKKEVYANLGINFSEVDVFYAFNSFEELKKIYEMFKKHAKKSAKLIHPGIGGVDFVRENFENLEAIEVGQYTVINKRSVNDN